MNNSNTNDNKDQLSYVSKMPDLEAWFKDFAEHLKSNPEKNVVHYPESFGKGFAKVFGLEEGLTYRIVDYQLNQDFVFFREPSDEFYLLIYFYEYSNCSRLYFEINNKLVVDISPENYNSLLMVNSHVTQKLFITQGTIVKGLTIQISEEWLKEKITHPETANYALFKEMDVFQAFLNPKSKKLLKEIFDNNSTSPIPSLYINNRIFRLLEMFLEDFLKNGKSGNTLPNSAADSENIQKVESYLIENYNKEFPGLEALAGIACMSASKLKIHFKNAYGMTVYQYFQKNKMHSAKELLNSGKYSVTEVGYLIGYQNLSNFSSAFKKEFGHLPKNFDKIG